MVCLIYSTEQSTCPVPTPPSCKSCSLGLWSWLWSRSWPWCRGRGCGSFVVNMSNRLSPHIVCHAGNMQDTIHVNAQHCNVILSIRKTCVQLTPSTRHFHGVGLRFKVWRVTEVMFGPYMFAESMSRLDCWVATYNESVVTHVHCKQRVPPPYSTDLT